MIELQGEIDEFTITETSVTDRSTGRKLTRIGLDWADSSSQLVITDICMILHRNNREHRFFSSSHRYSPKQTISWSVKHPLPKEQTSYNTYLRPQWNYTESNTTYVDSPGKFPNILTSHILTCGSKKS